MLHITLFVFMTVLRLSDANAKKSKTKSDLMLLVDMQNRWKAFWSKATVNVSVKNCREDCGWQHLTEEESNLRTETVELVMKQPQYEAAMAEFLALSHHGANPKEYGMHCHASGASTRDDYCICVQETGDWGMHCSSSKDKQHCRSFLSTMCGIGFQAEGEGEDLDDFEDLEDTEARLTRGIGEVQEEKSSETEEHLLRLQTALTNLDNERKELFEVHAEMKQTAKQSNRAVRPLLASIDQRIKRQKDKILRDMEELVNRRENEVKKEAAETQRGEEEYHKRLKALLEDEHEM